ncbi:hypothetical protein CEUSTIGMA_g12041.t1 [Chlamydomonas eustigma]|uniref:Uncharacterized protein n=1 Tax=Chlamydomonas eustigma TaxID=1157962 RepID=A0A250XP93_9CHLO|nr:hypothetical protein CEUSTIGMA_g12041.t1 [Chlamydomonas eustigma]|eukprot:GAX84620.1 hypothetical protein CEUSTIGMA_g12041.t1 [Chlamydomonas eustigma]
MTSAMSTTDDSDTTSTVFGDTKIPCDHPPQAGDMMVILTTASSASHSAEATAEEDHVATYRLSISGGNNNAVTTSMMKLLSGTTTATTTHGMRLCVAMKRVSAFMRLIATSSDNKQVDKNEGEVIDVISSYGSSFRPMLPMQPPASKLSKLLQRCDSTQAAEVGNHQDTDSAAEVHNEGRSTRHDKDVRSLHACLDVNRCCQCLNAKDCLIRHHASPFDVTRLKEHCFLNVFDQQDCATPMPSSCSPFMSWILPACAELTNKDSQQSQVNYRMAQQQRSKKKNPMPSKVASSRQVADLARTERMHCTYYEQDEQPAAGDEASRPFQAALGSSAPFITADSAKEHADKSAAGKLTSTTHHSIITTSRGRVNKAVHDNDAAIAAGSSGGDGRSSRPCKEACRRKIQQYYQLPLSSTLCQCRHQQGANDGAVGLIEVHSNTPKSTGPKRRGSVLAPSIHGPLASSIHGPLASSIHGPLASSIHGPLASSIHGPLASSIHGPLASSIHGPLASSIHGPLASSIHGGVGVGGGALPHLLLNASHQRHHHYHADATSAAAAAGSAASSLPSSSEPGLSSSSGDCNNTIIIAPAAITYTRTRHVHHEVVTTTVQVAAHRRQPELRGTADLSHQMSSMRGRTARNNELQAARLHRLSSLMMPLLQQGKALSDCGKNKAEEPEKEVAAGRRQAIPTPPASSFKRRRDCSDGLGDCDRQAGAAARMIMDRSPSRHSSARRSRAPKAASRKSNDETEPDAGAVRAAHKEEDTNDEDSPGQFSTADDVAAASVPPQRPDHYVDDQSQSISSSTSDTANTDSSTIADSDCSASSSDDWSDAEVDMTDDDDVLCWRINSRSKLPSGRRGRWAEWKGRLRKASNSSSRDRFAGCGVVTRSRRWISQDDERSRSRRGRQSRALLFTSVMLPKGPRKTLTYRPGDLHLSSLIQFMHHAHCQDSQHREITMACPAAAHYDADYAAQNNHLLQNNLIVPSSILPTSILYPAAAPSKSSDTMITSFMNQKAGAAINGSANNAVVDATGLLVQLPDGRIVLLESITPSGQHSAAALTQNSLIASTSSDKMVNDGQQGYVVDASSDDAGGVAAVAEMDFCCASLQQLAQQLPDGRIIDHCWAGLSALPSTTTAPLGGTLSSSMTSYDGTMNGYATSSIAAVISSSGVLDTTSYMVQLPDGRVIGSAAGLGPAAIVPAIAHQQLPQLPASSQHGTFISGLQAAGYGSATAGAVAVDASQLFQLPDGRVAYWERPEPTSYPMSSPCSTLNYRQSGDDSAQVMGVDASKLFQLPDGRVAYWERPEPTSYPMSSSPCSTLNYRQSGDNSVQALAVDATQLFQLPDGRVAYWEPAKPGVQPVTSSPHGTLLSNRQAGEDSVQAVAVDATQLFQLPDGRVAYWEPAKPGVQPVTSSPHGTLLSNRQAGEDSVQAVAVDATQLFRLPDGRVAYWEPTKPGAPPACVMFSSYWV